MALTNQQKKKLAQSAHLTWMFRDLMAEKSRQKQNEARKSVKTNKAETSFHAATVALIEDSNKFQSFHSKYSQALENPSGEAKMILVNIINDFPFEAVNDQTQITDAVIDQMATQTYSPEEGVTLNVFDLIIDQAFEAEKQNAIMVHS